MIQIAGYKASPWGNRFHQLRHDEALGAGSAGPGKTTCLAMDALPQIFIEHRRCKEKAHPHHIEWGASKGWALHLRRTTKQLKQTILFVRQIFRQLDPGAVWHEQDLTWVFSSGYHYQFGHCKDPGDWEDYFSNAYTHIGFDELVQFEQEQYDQIKSRCRSDDPVLMRMKKVRAMSNPLMRLKVDENFTVSDPYWVRKYFIEPAKRGNTTIAVDIQMDDGTMEKYTRIYLPATLADNPNKAFAHDYEKQLQVLKPHQRAALLRGDWYAQAGSYYGDEWNDKIHVCEPFHIPADWPIFRSLDWGNKKPGTCGWGTLDPEDNLYVFREFTFQGKDAKWVAEQIKDIEISLGLWQGKKHGRSLISGPADTQLWEDRGQVGKTKYQTMAEEGVGWVQADKKSRRANAEKLLGRLRDHKGGTQTPGIVFFRTCTKCIETIPVIPTDPGDAEAPMDGGEDHWHDMVLYMCAYASRGRKGVGRARRADTRTDDERFDDDRKVPENRGMHGYGSMD